MKTTHRVFKETLTETGFGNYKPSQMSNSDYWMCTEKAMDRYADEFSIGFAEWIKNNFTLHQKGEKYYLRMNSILWKDNTPTILYSEKELLEMYKKQLE